MSNRILRRKRVLAQMTIELAACIPVMIVIAVVAVNALLFLSECAAYDNAFRESVRVHASSPAYGQDLSAVIACVDAQLAGDFTDDYQSSAVVAQGAHSGYVTFTGTLTFYPTLFGMGLRSHVFGVSLPSASHSVSLTIDSYKPGVVL